MTVMLRAAGVAGLIALAIGTSGCARVRGHSGYMLDQGLAASIQPGIDNRDSVAKTIGRPTFEGQFDKNDWYYVTRETRQYGFSQPKPISQTVLRVHFDAAGNVASVASTGVDQVVSISPTSKSTPTLGRKRGFFQDLFGNIGAVGAGGMGGGAGGGPGGTNP